MSALETPAAPSEPPAATATTPRLHAVAFPILWLVTRLGTFLVLATGDNDVAGDVNYYYGQLRSLMHGSTSLANTLREYPVPALGVLLPQYLAAQGNEGNYLRLFIFVTLAIDMAFTLALWRAGNQRLTQGLWLWLLFVPFLGPIVFTRFDLVPAVLAASGLLMLARRPVWSGVATAAGAAIKLWPVLALPSLLLPRAGRRRVTRGFGAAALVAVAVTVAVAGVGRTISPITWQSDRGLEMESVGATPMMALRALTSGSRWSVAFTKYGSQEIFGPGVRAAEAIATALSIASLLLLGWLWWQARNRVDSAIQVVGWLIVVAALLFVDTDKTLSPQYLIWIAAPLAALAALRPSASTRVAVIAIIVIAGISQIEYPLEFQTIVSPQHTLGSDIGVVALVLRNLGLVWLTSYAVRQAYREIAASVLTSSP